MVDNLLTGAAAGVVVGQGGHLVVDHVYLFDFTLVFYDWFVIEWERSFYFVGTHRFGGPPPDSSSRAVDASHASSVADDDDDDDDDDGDGDGDSSELDGGRSSTSGPIPPSSTATLKWTSLLAFPRVMDGGSRNASLGPSSKARSCIRRWADSDTAPSFSAPRREDCLHSAFEAFKKSHQDLFKFASFSADSAGAAAHAIIHASDIIRGFLDLLVESVKDPHWSSYFTKVREDAKSTIFAPLDDAATCCAAVYGGAVAQIRKGVTAAADDSIKSVLKSKPPAGGFFFGDPADALHAQLSYAFMSSSLKAKAPARSRGSLSSVASRPSRQPAKSTTSSSALSSTKPTGNAGGRSSRGGKAGQRKK